MDRPKRIAASAAAASLPDDALVEILSRAPAKSLYRFKCVSRSWRDLIADRLRCTRLPRTLEGFFYIFDGADNEDEMIGADSDAQGCFINMLGKPSPLASFAFLGKQPGIKEFRLLRSCNGLLLFTHRRVGDTYTSLGYIVCNPATEQWVAVPSSGRTPRLIYLWVEEGDDSEHNGCFAYLVFDPAVSPHFQSVEFWTDETVYEVNTYSSETGVCCQRRSPWSDEAEAFIAGSVFVSGMLHLSVTSFAGPKIDPHLIVAVDGEGKNCRIIHGLDKRAPVVFVGQSQRCLHYMNQHRDNTSDITQLSIWVLKDYDTEEWVLKHSASCSCLEE